MTSPTSQEAYRDKSKGAGTKPTMVGVDASGEFIWARKPTPAQDEAWIASMHEWRDRALSHAKHSSKLSVRYFRMAAETTNPDRAAHYAAEGRRLRRKAREYLREARNRNV